MYVCMYVPHLLLTLLAGPYNTSSLTFCCFSAKSVPLFTKIEVDSKQIMHLNNMQNSSAILKIGKL